MSRGPSSTSLQRTDPLLTSRIKRLSSWFSLVVLIVSGIVIIGWASETEPLQFFKPIAAVSFILLSISLLLKKDLDVLPQPEKEARLETIRKLKDITACVLTAITLAASLIEFESFCFGWTWSMERLITNAIPGSDEWLLVGSMTPHEALGIILISLSILSIDRKTLKRFHAHEVLAVLAILLAMMTLLGCIFGIPHFCIFISCLKLSMAGGILFATLCLSALLVRPDQGYAQIITSRHTGGKMARRLFPAAFGVPLLLGWLKMMGQHADFFDGDTGLAVLMVLMMLIFLLVLWKNSASLDKLEQGRQLALDRLAESEKRTRSILRGATDSFIAIDMRGMVRDWNDQAERTFGFPRDEAVGVPLTELVVPGHKREAAQGYIENTLAKMIARGDVSQVNRVFTFTAQTKAGRELPMEISAFPVLLDQQSLICGFARDISERMKTEDLLRASELRARTMIENMPVALVVMNPGGIIDMVNPSTEDLFSYSIDDLRDEHIVALFSEDDRKDQKRFLKELLKTARGTFVERMARKKRGDQFPVEVSISEIYTLNEPRFLVSIVDVTQRRQLEIMREEFVDMVSHDLRTPLSSIRLVHHMTLKGVYGDISEKVKKQLQSAERNVTRLLTLVNDLLDFDKMAAGKLELNLVETSVSDIIMRSVESVTSIAEEKKVSIEIPDTQMVVMMDPDRIVQVMVNLLSNAVKFSDNESKVVIDVNQEDGFFKASVRDFGRGIAPEFQRVVFEKYKQVERTDTTVKRGIGLGLPICKAIIEQHDGVIGVTSEPGKGSVFYFKLPSKTTDVAAQPEKVAEVSQGSEK